MCLDLFRELGTSLSSHTEPFTNKDTRSYTFQDIRKWNLIQPNTAWVDYTRQKDWMFGIRGYSVSLLQDVKSGMGSPDGKPRLTCVNVRHPPWKTPMNAEARELTRQIE